MKNAPRPVLLLALLALAAPVAAQGPTLDQWSEPIVLRASDGQFSVPIHATLLPDGRVFFIGYERGTEAPDPAANARRASFFLSPSLVAEPVPPQVIVTGIPEPLDLTEQVIGDFFVHDDLFCTGNSLTSDGELFTAGGTRYFLNLITSELQIIGLSYATLYDGTSWTRLPEDMLAVGALGAPARWYPAVTRLPDERMLVTGGYDIVSPVGSANLSTEAYDPATGTWEVISPPGEPPFSIFNYDYTHPVVLPERIGDFDLLMFGHDGVPVLHSTDGPERWSVSANERTGTQLGELPNLGATSVLLPIRWKDGQWGYGNGSMLLAGGDHGTSAQQSIDVYDPVADEWPVRRAMPVRRHHPTGVLLPDGRVLVVAGHNANGGINLRRATYVDPRNDFAVSLGTSFADEVRGYHNVALLLPDGRVLVGGGRDLDTAATAEKSNFRFLYPSYLFEERPEILFAPEEVGYGGRFPVVSRGKRPREVVLMALGSMTHSFDFNQRSIQLPIEKFRAAFLADDHLFWVKMPRDAQQAPPGYYMLFVLDQDRVPSQAAIVRLR